MRGILFLTLLTCSFIGLKAQTESIADQAIDEVRVTTVMKPSVVSSSTPLQVLSSDDLARLGSQSMSDAVRRFSGVVVKDFGGIGGLKTVAIRGVGAEHTTVLYDGMTVSNAQSGQIDLSKYPLNNVSMLSLSIGQSDDIFRSAKAFASVGTLSIETVKPQFADNKNYQGQAQLKTGSWGYFSPYVYYAHKLSNKFSASLDGSWQRADGIFPYTTKVGITPQKGKRKNTDVDMLRGELNVFGHLSASQDLRFKAYIFDSDRGLPEIVRLDVSDSDYHKRLKDKDYFTQVIYTNAINSQLDWQVKGKYSHFYTHYSDILSGKLDASIYKQDEMYASTVARYKLGTDFSIAVAEDFSYNTMSANYNSFAIPRRYSFLTSLTAKYETTRLTLIGNLMGTYITDRVKIGTNPKDKKRLSPTLSASYRLLKSSDLRLRTSFKSVFRVPTFNELYYKKMGNLNIAPEKSQQYNLGLTYSSRFSDFFDYFRITSDVYYNNVTDKVIVYNTSFEPIVKNMGKVDIKGLDISADGNVNLGQQIALHFSASYTYLKAIDKTKYENNKHYKDQIPYTPKHSGAASASIENPWVNIAYSFVASGETYSIPQAITQNRVRSYIDHTVSANKTFSLGAYKLRLQGEIVNLANANYSIIQAFPMPGRSFSLLLNMKF